MPSTGVHARCLSRPAVKILDLLLSIRRSDLSKVGSFRLYEPKYWSLVVCITSYNLNNFKLAPVDYNQYGFIRQSVKFQLAKVSLIARLF